MGGGCKNRVISIKKKFYVSTFIFFYIMKLKHQRRKRDIETKIELKPKIKWRRTSVVEGIVFIQINFTFLLIK